MAMSTAGIHHITALAGDPQRNVDFYTGFLGMRLVKQTVNFDAPDVYHLYYGDDIGRPGSCIETSAVLPVQNMDTSYVRDARDMVRAGDIVRARICKIEKNDVDLAIVEPDLGVIKAFCTNCRHEMALKKGSLICTDCGKKETRKISEEYPSTIEEGTEE